MTQAYQVGQEIRIRPVVEQGPSLRESAMQPYVGKTATVAAYYWIEPPAGGVFYLYTVRVNGSNRELVLYEDEMSAVSRPAPDKRR